MSGAAGGSVALSVVMPAFNESEILTESVQHVVERLRARDDVNGRFELLVVENGSTDDTLSIARRLATEMPEVRVLQRAEADYGAALRAGLLDAAGDLVVNFDCDYYDIDFLDRAIARLRSDGGPAMVVGSKRAPGADDRRSIARRAVTWTFSTILRVGFGLNVSDTHGMKAMRRAALLPSAEQCTLGRDLFDTELIIRAERAGLAIDEIPVSVVERRPARSPLARRVPRTLLGLLRLRRALGGNS
ncbi:MAG TPA: glycosyltransferase family 2 protein [Acidimicrobiia bacterium]|jgi:glycosyltransferase involved in cell wall biosynthesis